MVDRVLGFRKKDAYDECGHGCHWKIEKFVPVVSVEWLKKYCKEAKFEHKLCACGHKGDVLIIHNLLVAVEKEACKK